MEVINTVVGKMVEVLTDRFLTSMGRRIGYVVHYKKNIEDLDTKVQNLRGVRGRIEGKVDTARNNGHVIETDVLDWLTDVNKKEEDLKRLLVDRENIKSCFNVRSRYRLGKEGKKLLTDVSGLIGRGNNFDTVGHRAPLDKIWYTPTKNYEQFESRELVHKHIIKALENDIIYKIGIYGMGGSGKTRTAEEIAKQTQEEKLFDEVAKVVFSQIPHLEKIQEELAVCLNMSFETKTKVGRKGELCNRLKNGKKILLIIDDVWSDEVMLEEIGIPSSDNRNKGCKVLLTSRREDVCIKMGVQENFPIGLLHEYEAWDLFKKTVGDFIESPHEIHCVAKQVCRECNCLPLAILVVGATLSNQKEKHVWDDAFVQLSSCRGYNIEGVTEKLYSRIEWSYNYLRQPDSRSCFLYCSLFPEDAEIPIDVLVMYGVATKFLKDNSYTMKTARDRTLVLVDTLKKSHLLLEGKRRDFVKMHNVIRDVAISIASKEGFLAKTGVPQWPEKDEYESHKIISLRSKNIRELPCELECSELRTLVLECDISHRPQAPDSFFKRTKKVEVLDLHHVRLPSSLLNLINLRMLRLCNCGHVNLAFLKELRNLEILGIADSNLKQVAVEVGQLTTLRWLDLRRCTKLEIIPSCVIKSLSNIEELYIPCDFGGWGDEGNAGLDELNSLTRLTNLQIHIGDGMLLPNELCFELLNRFKISIGRTSGFKYYEENVGGAKMLKLDDITLRKEFTILMAKADVLVLERMEGLKNVLHFGDGKGFLELKYLKIKNCSDMEHLLGRPKWNLQTQDSFSKLNVLIVKNCTLKFLFFPSMARALLQLQKLDISNCQMMEEIILDDEEVMDRVIFCQLKEMNLQCLPIFRSICGNKKKMSTTECTTSTDAQALFNEKVSFPALEKLDIRELNSVTTICMGLNRKEQSDHRVDSYLSLTSVSIDSCNSLRNVFSSSIARNLQELQYLSLTNCEKIDEIITVESGQTEEEVTEDDEIIVFPQLKTIGLRLLPGLKSFWFGSKKAAVEPQVQVQALFNDKVKFPSLEEFEYSWNKNNLKEIWSSTVPIDAFCKLRKLRVRHCDKLLSIAPPSKLLQNLEEVYIEDCPNLEKGLETPGVEKVSFPALRTLRLYYCEQVNLAFLKELRNLEILCIADSNLKEVAVEVGQLTTLRWLDLSNCKMLKIISSGVIKSLSNIEELYIPYNFRGWGDEGNARLDELNSLTRLTNLQIHIGDGMLLPNELCFKLDRFKISIGRTSGFKYDEENLGAKMLKLDDIALRKEFNILMEKAEVLFLERVKCLKNYVLHSGDGKRFLDLKYLKIENSRCMGHLLGKPEWNLQTPGSFRKLSVLIVKNCMLKDLFFPSMARGLPKLQELEISQCEIMEEIILDDEEVMDEVIFPQLKKMKLGSLPILGSICCDTKKMSQALFNEKVSFPALEELQISELDSVTKIWDNQLFIGPEAEGESFQQLRHMKIDRMKKLENVIPSNLIPRLQNLETLIIRWCDLVVSAVDVLTTAPKMELPRLQNMSLYRLPKLMLMGLNAKEHSAKRLTGAYSNLTSLSIDRCDRLRNVFSSSITRNLRRLQDLTVRYCEEMEEIIAVDKQQEEEEVMDDGIIVFPELKKMELRLLPKLKSFWSKNEAVEDDILQVQSLFNHKAKFISLEEFIYVGSNVKEIWNNTVPTDSFCKLRRMVVYRCEKLLSIAPSKLLGSFRNLEELRISTCPSLENVFKVEGGSKFAKERKVARDKDIEKKLEIISELPSLVKMEIKGCPKLKSAAFYVSKEKVVFPILNDLTLSNGSIFEDIWNGHVPAATFSKVRKLRVEKCSMLVNVPTLLQRFEVVEELSLHNCSSLEVVFKLEGVEDIERGATVSSPIKKLELTDLPKLVHIGKMDFQGRAFHNLTSLRVIRCHSLKYLFSFSMARNLTKIEHLWVDYCDAIEEIIRNEDQGEEDGIMDEIVFPNLQHIHLEGLPNLTSFCSANNAFKLPSLRQVFLFGSPKMQTFTFGRISTPIYIQ